VNVIGNTAEEASERAYAVMDWLVE